MPVKNVKKVEMPAILSELYKGNQSKVRHSLRRKRRFHYKAVVEKSQPDQSQ